MAKRAKQVQAIVDSMNSYLRANKIINELSTECMLMTEMLLNAGCYKGFNWFYAINDDAQALVGSGDPEVITSKNGYIQFY